MKKILILSLVAVFFLGSIQISYADEAITLATSEWPPYEYTGEDGIPMGSDVEIIQEIFEEIGVPLEIEFYPWSRAVDMSQRGNVDGLFSLSKTEERMEWLVFPEEPINISRNVFFYREGEDHSFDNLEDLEGLDIGITRGYSYGDDFMNSDLYGLHEADSDELNFRMLAGDRIDLFVSDQLVGVHLLEELDLNDEIGYLENSLSEFDMYVAFSKEITDSQELADKFDQGLRQIKEDGRYDEILNEYR